MSTASTPAEAVIDTTSPVAIEPQIEPESVIEAVQSPSPALNGPYQAPGTTKKNAGKLTTQYVMPDGSVITGKGLGRGRPGFRRGPRKSKLTDDGSVEDMPLTPTQSTPSETTSTGVKRKRSESEASRINPRSISYSTGSRDSSVEYNPTATQTRSGRQTQKPVALITTATTPSATASPASKKVVAPITASTPTLKTHPKIKRKVYRGKEQLALCEHCLRGFGPSGNAIVFCDACNKCWHQKCHQPQISKEVVSDTKAEWFCATCDKILHGSKKKKPQLKTDQTPTKVIPKLAPPSSALVPGSVPGSVQRYGLPLVGAVALSLDQRRRYLNTLSREKLIDLVLHAGDLAPQMPIFETPIPPPLPPLLPPTSTSSTSQTRPQFTSNYVTPVFDMPAELDKNTKATSSTATAGGLPASNEVNDEGYDDSFDEHALLYPKVGEGVKLPPEKDDLNMLLEGPDCRTFSHWIRGMPVKVELDTVSFR